MDDLCLGHQFAITGILTSFLRRQEYRRRKLFGSWVFRTRSFLFIRVIRYRREFCCVSRALSMLNQEPTQADWMRFLRLFMNRVSANLAVRGISEAPMCLILGLVPIPFTRRAFRTQWRLSSPIASHQVILNDTARDALLSFNYECGSCHIEYEFQTSKINSSGSSM